MAGKLAANICHFSIFELNIKKFWDLAISLWFKKGSESVDFDHDETAVQ